METMLMLRHYLDKLTLSEFNCLLVGNHATVAGFVFALFVLFGVRYSSSTYKILLFFSEKTA